jgi:hypothetical protein
VLVGLLAVHPYRGAKVPFSVDRDGIEPPTQGFSVLCSTD